MDRKTVSNIQLEIHLVGLLRRGGPVGDGSLPGVTDLLAPDSDRPAQLLALVTIRLGERLNAVSRAAAGCAATGPELLVLALHRPGVPVHVLADAVGLSRSGAVRALDRLEAAGLLLRRDAPDHRSSLVLLTPAGTAAAQRVLRARRRVADEVLASLPATLAHALPPALELMAVELSGPGGPGDAFSPSGAVSDR